MGMKYAERITFDAEQCGGRPCIRHYRLRVKDVLDMLAAGVGEKEILEDYSFREPDWQDGFDAIGHAGAARFGTF